MARSLSVRSLQFQRLQRQAELADYVSSTWINGTTWCPSDWTVFKQAVRTNNDLEGWESWPQPPRAARRGRLPLYVLIKLLHREAQLTAIHIRLVSEKKLRRIHCRKYRDLQARIFALWDQYEAEEKTVFTIEPTGFAFH